MNTECAEASAVLSDSELRTLLLQYRRENWQGIQTPKWQEWIVENLLRHDGAAVLRQLEDCWQMPPGARILDIGSGVGSFVVACRERGLLAFGVEPDRIGQGGRLTSVQIAKRRLRERAFAVALGERLPFADQSFDLVTLNQVMEHVFDQAAVLREAARVLKPGGALYIACPNYLRFREPHYKIFWLPLLPKPLGRCYLKMRGRNPILLRQLTYTTNAGLRALFQGLGMEYTAIDLHRSQFLKKSANGSFFSRRARLATRMARVPGLGRAIIWAALWFLRLSEGGCEMLILRRPRSADDSC